MYTATCWHTRLIHQDINLVTSDWWCCFRLLEEMRKRISCIFRQSIAEADRGSPYTVSKTCSWYWTIWPLTSVSTQPTTAGRHITIRQKAAQIEFDNTTNDDNKGNTLTIHTGAWHRDSHVIDCWQSYCKQHHLHRTTHGKRFRNKQLRGRDANTNVHRYHAQNGDRDGKIAQTAAHLNN